MTKGKPYLPASKRLIREQFLRVVKLAEDFEVDAARSADAGAFYGACLMLGCALEAMLLADVLAFEPDMERDGTWPESRRPPEQWSLSELVKFHLEQGWIGADDPAAARLAEAVEAMNELRNVVAHPGRLIREALDFEFDEQVFAGMFAVLHATYDEIISGSTARTGARLLSVMSGDDAAESRVSDAWNRRAQSGQSRSLGHRRSCRTMTTRVRDD